MVNTRRSSVLRSSTRRSSTRKSNTLKSKIPRSSTRRNKTYRSSTPRSSTSRSSTSRSSTSRSKTPKTVKLVSPARRYIIRSFMNRPVLTKNKHPRIIDAICDYVVNGCESTGLVGISPYGHSNKTSGKQIIKLDWRKHVEKGTHIVTELRFNDYFTWLLFNGSEVVGNVHIFEMDYTTPSPGSSSSRREPHQSKKYIYVTDICARQGKGYGKILLYSLFAHYEKENIDFELYSLIGPRGFYNKIGFKPMYSHTYTPDHRKEGGRLNILAWQIKKILNNYKGTLVKPVQFM